MNDPKISLVVAISENHVMANKGKIPWKIPSDITHYRDIINGHIIIAGRKTFDETYPETINIVVTRDTSYIPPTPAVVVHSLEEALEKAKSKELMEKTEYKHEIMIIGGGEIFRESIAIADKLYLTIIHKTLEGDTFFPDYSAFTKVIRKEDREENGYSFTFLDLER